MKNCSITGGNLEQDTYGGDTPADAIQVKKDRILLILRVDMARTTK